jgi:predicted nuclease of predicted toxin-antitoxin system
VKLLLDEGVALRAAASLRDAGVDTRHVLELSLQGEPDEILLDWAKREDRVLVAHDSDFHRILAMTQATKPSAIRLRGAAVGHADVTAQLIELLRNPDLTSALRVGAVVSVTDTQVRVRMLPIRG